MDIIVTEGYTTEKCYRRKGYSFYIFSHSALISNVSTNARILQSLLRYILNCDPDTADRQIAEVDLWSRGSKFFCIAEKSVTLLFRETNKSYASGIVAKKRMSLFEKFSAKKSTIMHFANAKYQPRLV